MLCCKIDLPVYDSSITLVYSHRYLQMDPHGDHAAQFKRSFGATTRHENVRRLLAKQMLRPAGLVCNEEATLLIPDICLRSADIFFQTAPDPSGSLETPRHIAYDIQPDEH